jgi:5'-methylthioadenosine phosphorylase
MTDPATADDLAPELRPQLGVIGGSGLYALLDDPTEISVDTPYGPTSAPITVAHVGERAVAFLPRHGLHHEHPPHKVPYRANLWALHHLGVRHVLAPCASGSLQADIGPGSFVVPDQLVDRTAGRPSTFYDGPEVHHLSFADPYCPSLRRAAVDACRAEDVEVHEGGTVVVVEGPRFSTRAESRWYASMGWEVINMTQLPEAALAAEAGLGYAAIALITDHDVGVEGASDAPVTHDAVFATFEANLERVRRVLLRALASDLEPCHHEPGPGFG